MERARHGAPGLDTPSRQYRTLEVETHIICYNRDVNGCYTNGLRSKYRGTGWETNLPWGYFDTQVDDDHNYPNWTVGSADTRGMRAGVSYWTWIYAFKGSDNYTSGATAFQVGHRDPSWCSSTLCVFPDQTRYAIPRWNLYVPTAQGRSWTWSP